MSGPLSHIEPMERALVAAGFPAMSPWWRATVERFYQSGRRQLVLRVGRRGGKSSTLCRLAVLEAVFGSHKVPPGDVGIVGLISTTRTEAASRLRTIRAILDALSIPYRERGDTIELTTRPIVFAVFTASVAGVVGGTWVAALADEVARWADSDSGANPATEVLASLRPCLATMPNAKLFLSSSPLGSNDAHAVAFDQGDTGFQLVARAATWEANPELTEEATKALEPNERVHRREFGAIPQGTLSAVFDLRFIEAAMARQHPAEVQAQHERVMAIDASRGGDAWTYAVARYITPAAGLAGLAHGELPPARRVQRTWSASGWIRTYQVQDARGEWRDEAPEVTAARPMLFVEEVGEVPDASNADDAVEFLGRRCLSSFDGQRIRRVLADQYEFGALSVLLKREGLRPHELTWTAPSKSRAVDRFDRMLRDGSIALPRVEKLRKQLAEYSEKITRAGTLTYSGAGRHDDYAAVCVLLAYGEIENLIPGSPVKPGGGRHEVYVQ